MHLQHTIDQVEDPVVCDSGTRIGRGFPSTGEMQARLGDLDDERRLSRVGRHVVTWRATHDADVRLGLGAVVEDDRALGLDEPALAERSLQRFRGE